MSGIRGQLSYEGGSLICGLSNREILRQGSSTPISVKDPAWLSVVAAAGGPRNLGGSLNGPALPDP